MTLSGPLMALLFGSPYRAAAGALVVYCVAVLLVAVNQPLTVYLQTSGRDMPVGYLMAGLSLLNIPVVLLLSREFGQTGARRGFSWSRCSSSAAYWGCGDGRLPHPGPEPVRSRAPPSADGTGR